MNRFILIFIFVWVTLITNAQAPPSFAGLSTGVSIPLGRFHEKSLDGGSFAQTGWKSQAEGAWYSRIGLGAGLQAGYGAYSVDVEALAEEKMKGNAFIDSMSVRSDPVRVITLAGLAEYSFSLSPGLSLRAKAGGGIVYSWSPYQLYKPHYYMIGPEWYEITSDYDLGPWITAGADLRFSVCECLELRAGISYNHGFLTYQFLTGTGDIRTEEHQVISIDCLGGISYSF